MTSDGHVCSMLKGQKSIVMETPKGQKLRIMAIWAGIATAILVLLFAPSAQAQISVRVNNGISFMNGKTTVKYSDWQKDYKIEFEGDFELSDDDSDIIEISRGGYFEISRSVFGNKRRVVIEADNNGNLIKDYYVGRDKVDFDSEGREWLAEVLPGIVRSTTIGSESRVNRFYRQGGVEAVMDEVEELKGDYLKSHYIRLLLERRGLTSDEVSHVLEEASREVDSDHYLSEILMDNEDLFFADEESLEAYIEASEAIDSDHYRSQVLRNALESEKISGDLLSMILRSAEDIGSDHYLSEVLKETLEERELTDELIQELIKSARTIGSDHYQSALFREALEHERISEKSYWEIIDAAGDISSDHYKTELFKELLEKDLNDEALTKMIRNIEEDVSSDHYSHILLTKIITEQALGAEAMESFVGAIKEVDSDHYASQIIMRAAEDSNLTDKLVSSLLESARDIGSDHYLSQALISLSGYINDSSNDSLRSLYRNIAKEIGSDTYYGRAMKALD